MSRLFWIFLLAGIALVVLPFFTAFSTAAAIMLWILGSLLIIAAFFMLPGWWARPVSSVAGAGGYTGAEGEAMQPFDTEYLNHRDQRNEGQGL